MIRNLRELYQYRTLLWSLTTRELRARYRGSMLGFLWTFLNPALLMTVYALVFRSSLRQEIEHYTLFLFVGLLPWLWFSTSLTSGASSLSDRRDLLSKVRFPPQVLPATVVLTNGINFLLSLPLVLVLSLAYGVRPSWHMVLLPVLIAVQALLTLALAYLLSAANVTFRDVQQVAGNVITLAFFLTPILYSREVIPAQYREWVLYVNPMAALATSYQDLLYYHRLFDYRPLLCATGISIFLMTLASAYFGRNREHFAELV
jgi:lipopolysaccharide transport system permease protein